MFDKTGVVKGGVADMGWLMMLPADGCMIAVVAGGSVVAAVVVACACCSKVAAAAAVSLSAAVCLGPSRGRFAGCCGAAWCRVECSVGCCVVVVVVLCS